MTKLRVDVWGGPMSMQHLGRQEFDTLDQAVPFIGEMLDSGMLINLLHEDFAAPAEEVSAAADKVIKMLEDMK
ncbi:hypothetical protein PARHAE_03280 [Paracoccus haematequi]|uniref:Uncharacterized protein n=1 Tax=Paracoccus haematequi TaxID=2491866 RepID=A0A447IRE9_9RHOB|nr:hypothetical protein [Paracoccus haematequi]VDS10069.1 hypothetical protein PARHAE_03280 [Paracoccus haematequi]